MRPLLPFLLLLVLIGCKSADELYNEGQRLEMEGQYEAAVRHYADALDKQPDLEKARGRLLEAGKVAVQGYLADLDAAEQEGAWVEAGDLHLRADGVAAVAGRAGVQLPLPDDYPARRAANFEAAITTLLDGGEALVARGAFADAIQGYDRARRYSPTMDDEAALADATLGAYTAWAEADLAAGRFRAAFGHTEQALALLPPESLAAAELVGLQNEVLERGSIRTAVTPLWRAGGGVARSMPRSFRDALNDALEIDYWIQPAPFVAMLEPVLVRRELRAFGLERETLDPREAARVGRALDVDVVFVGEIDAFNREVEEKERENITKQTRGGDRLTYSRVEEEVTFTANVTFEIVEVASQRVLCTRDTERALSTRIERGVYEGRVRDLGLTREERDLFDADALDDQERDLERRLADELARRVAEHAFDCIVRLVP